MSLSKVKEEEEALEKEFLATISNQDVENDDSTTASTDQEPTSTEVPTPEPEVIVQKEETKQPVDPPDKQDQWKERFSKYKASTDITISNLRKEKIHLLDEISKLNVSIKELKEKVDSTKPNLQSDLISDEEAELIGPEAAEIFKKAAAKMSERATAPLAEELKRIKEGERAKEERAQAAIIQEKRIKFLSDLGDRVKDYRVIDKDPKFAAYLNQIDPTSGEARIVQFRMAEDFFDVDRVADFFLAFKEVSNTSSNKKVNLQDNVTPVGNSSSPSTTTSVKDSGEVTTAYIEKFFSDVAKGLYKNRQKEAMEIEDRIEKAYIAGKIRD